VDSALHSGPRDAGRAAACARPELWAVCTIPPHWRARAASETRPAGHVARIQFYASRLAQRRATCGGLASPAPPPPARCHRLEPLPTRAPSRRRRRGVLLHFSLLSPYDAASLMIFSPVRSVLATSAAARCVVRFSALNRCAAFRCGHAARKEAHGVRSTVAPPCSLHAAPLRTAGPAGGSALPRPAACAFRRHAGTSRTGGGIVGVVRGQVRRGVRRNASGAPPPASWATLAARRASCLRGAPRGPRP